MTELNGAESEDDRIMATTKTVLKLMKQNGLIAVNMATLARTSSSCK
jgi:hypothetical protein